MQSIITTGAIVALTATAATASTNLVLNGDFENNSASDTIFNMSNGVFTDTVDNATGYGARQELDLVDMTPPFTWGLGAQSGEWKVGMNTSSGTNDAFSLDLASALVVGQSYTLSFWAALNTNSASAAGNVRIGTSSSATSFGTQIAMSSGLSGSAWTNFTVDFTASAADTFLTVESVGGYVDIDNITLVPTPGSAGLLTLAGLAATRRRR